MTYVKSFFKSLNINYNYNKVEFLYFVFGVIYYF